MVASSSMAARDSLRSLSDVITSTDSDWVYQYHREIGSTDVYLHLRVAMEVQVPWLIIGNRQLKSVSLSIYLLTNNQAYRLDLGDSTGNYMYTYVPNIYIVIGQSHRIHIFQALGGYGAWILQSSTGLIKLYLAQLQNKWAVRW